jgi:hypothetical protein
MVSKIHLANNKGIVLVDDVDVDGLSMYSWNLSKWQKTANHRPSIYVKRVDCKGKCILMHRQVLGILENPKLQVDHIDADGLNNTRKNLRLCTTMQNSQNARPRIGCSSKYKGVSWSKRRKKWRVRTHIDYRCYYLGYFEDEIEAAMAYDKAALEMFGEFARINFPYEIVQ